MYPWQQECEFQPTAHESLYGHHNEGLSLIVSYCYCFDFLLLLTLTIPIYQTFLYCQALPPESFHSVNRVKLPSENPLPIVSTQVLTAGAGVHSNFAHCS